METPALPSPQTTLVVLLGASEWPYFPELQGSVAFANTIQGVRNYFLSPHQFGIPPENLLDLFNSSKSSDELDEAIGQFLKTAGKAARDVLLYFVGHGGFVGRDSDFYLATRRTRADNPRVSSILMVTLADTILNSARHLRRYIILDCCFAGAAFHAFQAEPADIAIVKTIDSFKARQKEIGFPSKGTTLLSSSSHKTPSLLSPDGSFTMFSNALLETLSIGDRNKPVLLSLRDVYYGIVDRLDQIGTVPMPSIHSPDQSQGDVANVPFFPNQAVKNQQDEKPTLTVEQPRHTPISSRTEAEQTEIIKIFYCYAREDKLLRDELDKHLAALRHLGLVKGWHDGEIVPGTPWEEAITVQLETSQIILLLISSDFINSEYCYGKEMARAIERHHAKEARVIPVILRSVDWEGTPFSVLQMLPVNARPVMRWPDRDEALEDVAKGIRRAVKDIMAQHEANKKSQKFR